MNSEVPLTLSICPVCELMISGSQRQQRSQVLAIGSCPVGGCQGDVGGIPTVPAAVAAAAIVVTSDQAPCTTFSAWSIMCSCLNSR